MKKLTFKQKLKAIIGPLCLLGVVLAVALEWVASAQLGQKGTAQTLAELQLEVASRGANAVINIWQEQQLEEQVAADPLAASLSETGRAWGMDGVDPQDGWFFLPSYADLSHLRLLYAEGCEVLLDGQPAASGQWLDTVSADRTYQLTFIDAQGQSETATLHFMQSANTATVYLLTDSGGTELLDADKEYREGGQMALYDENGVVHYRDTLEYITERGNTSFTKLKRPYHIKLRQNADLLGMGSAGNWLLMANATDDTLLRNRIAYDMAAEVGLPYTAELRDVELYINGEYRGAYQLAEKIEIGGERVDITDLEAHNKQVNGDLLNVQTWESADGTRKGALLDVLPRDITGGYLLERNYDTKYAPQTSGFITEGGEHFIVRSPELADEAEVDYIAGVVQQVENAIEAEDGVDPDSGLHYTQLISLRSWAERYLFEEVVKNEGCLVTSSWFYKDSDSVDSLLYAGPIWDYDKSMGIYCHFAPAQGLTKMQMNGDSTDWWAILYDRPEFYQLVVQSYAEKYSEYIGQLAESRVQDYADNIAASAAMNRARWGLVDVETDVPYDTSTWQGSVDYLKSWWAGRKEYLDSLWIEGETWYTIRLNDLKTLGTPMEYLYRREGETLGALPQLTDPEEGRTVGWYIGYSGLDVDENTPAADMTLCAHWEAEEETAAKSGQTDENAAK